MKIELNTNLLVNIVIIMYAIFVASTFAMLYTWGSVKGTASSDETSSWIENLKSIDEQLPDSIPYRKYLQLRDSIKMVRALKNGYNLAGGSAQIGYIIGTYDSYLFCDTCTLKGYWHKVFDTKDKPMQYYIILPGWKLKAAKSNLLSPDSVIFYVENNKAYIRKLVTDSVIKTKTGAINTHLHEVDEPVKFRYNQKCLMIPVSKFTKNLLDKVLTGCGILFGLYLLYLVAAFLKFIIDLSKGLSFTTNNIFRLKLIAASLLIYPVGMICLVLIMRLIFHQYFTADVVLNNEIWSSLWKIIGLGIIFLLLFRAFRQGKLLKEEQDLTV
ncbi:DUF2975 domain-containing protein [Mucilaginibacter paludis]|uniref:DUF2975 domain-containing protein n=1 Tax=Mucilaginibacter paludis DSM 18603 TaxID=714943 RepID=H1Y107_9SPHI|nr:DUF2975 domain-containing protein [Mucilaginibacter paludis]EHQ29232.1 hypothetical protein Mucpa_5157 [Mucilaginibacter paludis DSM 18603]